MTRRGWALVLAAIAAVSGSSIAAAQSAARDDVEVIIAIDASESMDEAIGRAQDAATSFVDAMPDDLGIGVMVFADEVSVLTSPTTDHDLVRQLISTIDTGGDTALYDSATTAAAQFRPEVQNKVLVLLTDGADEGSSATLDDAVVATADVQVEAISLTTSLTDLDSLSALGTITSADDADGLAGAFERVAGLIVEVVEAPPATTTAPATTIAPDTAPVATNPPESIPVTTSPAVIAPLPEPGEPSSTLLWAGGAGLFVGLLLLGLFFFPRQRVSRRQLGVQKARSTADLGVRTTTAIDDVLERYGQRADLSAALAMADISMRPAEFVSAVGLVAVVAGLLALLVGGPLLAVVVGALVAIGARFWVKYKEDKRRAAFADQLPDVLQLITTSLRSGFGLTQAIEAVADEAEEPARSEFGQMLVETRLGRDLTESMRDLAVRMRSKDLEWVVAAIDINRETGGNLAEVLAQVGTTIRERGRIHRQVRTLTAEGRMSARVLVAMPFLMFAWQWRTNPENVELLTTGSGLVALIFAALLMAIGIFWVRRIVNSVAL